MGERNLERGLRSAGVEAPSQPRRIPGVYHTTRKQGSRVLRSSLPVYQPKSADFVGAVGVNEADLAVYETPKGTRAWRRAWKLYSRPFCDLHFSYTSDPCSRVVQGAACAAPGLGPPGGGWRHMTPLPIITFRAQQQPHRNQRPLDTGNTPSQQLQTPLVHPHPWVVAGRFAPPLPALPALPPWHGRWRVHREFFLL